MKYAVIKDQRVINVILADDNFIQNCTDNDCEYVDISSQEIQPGIGWAYADDEFSNQLLVDDTRAKKLNDFREKRDKKLTEVDHMCNELALGLRADLEAVKTYRQALLDITNQYKDVDGNANEAIDNIDLNSESLWPTKPSN